MIDSKKKNYDNYKTFILGQTTIPIEPTRTHLIPSIQKIVVC